jgi:ketosteroid isomerase-like protein
MPQNPVACVRELFERTNARDFAGAMDTYGDEVVQVLHGATAGLGGSPTIGKEAVGRWYAEWFGTFDSDYYFEIEEIRDVAPDRVLMIAKHHGTGRASGARLVMQGVWVYTVRDGKIVHIDVYNDVDAAQQAIRTDPN